MRIKAHEIEVMGPQKALAVARAIVTDVIAHTPVDEGHTVSSWEAGIGSPPVADRRAYAPGKDGSTATENRSAALDAALAVLSPQKPAGVPIYISNASEAIGYLNDGSSKQEPAGFIERAVAVGGIEAAKKHHG